MVLARTASINLGRDWAHERLSFSADVLCFTLAIAMHVPFFFMKLNHVGKHMDIKKDRLVSIEILPEVPKPEVALPPPPPKVKGPSLSDRLKKLVKREPPPPPAPKPMENKPPEKLAEAPKPIPLQQKLAELPKVQPKLESKEKFETKLDMKKIEDKKLAMNSPVGAAPLTASKVGTLEKNAPSVKDKGAFAVSNNEQIKEIGGGPTLSGASSGPQIAIKTGKASSEKFSAAPSGLSNKGRIGAIPEAAGGPSMGLRDTILARDAAPTQIATGNRSGGMPGGVTGGTGTKIDKGSYNTGADGGVAGSNGITVGGGRHAQIADSSLKSHAKKNMFNITGPLRDRGVTRQVTPEYPAWAQAQGVEASVILEFTVDSEGNVKPNVVVRRTSGYPKLDESAIRALRQWKFVALPEGTSRDEVGTITFTFSLS
jgi:TonB family protein